MDPVPGVGEHTDAILAGLGYGREEIAALRAAAAV
jgi:crotonobetainyl-CoA:carnitine CoA-transferase CaiB-like acyl-CoA transferase